MERLTIDTKILFCDISQCRETPGGSFCEDGYCDQRRVYERLREYERFSEKLKLGIEQMDAVFYRVNALGGTDLMAQYRALGPIADLAALVKARDEGRVIVLKDPHKPLTFKDKDNILCPNCEENLTWLTYNGFIAIQCPLCGQYLDITEAVAALKERRSGGMINND